MLYSLVLLLISGTAATAFAKHEILKRCACPEVQCRCVPVVGATYMSCQCTQSANCNCSALEQIQQCQPICQEVCQRSCTVNCAVCSTECFNSCSTISSAEQNDVPWISTTTSLPIISFSAQYDIAVPQATESCECSAPVCQCVPVVGKAYRSCSCHYSSPCMCSAEQQLQLCHRVCEDVCQRTCSSDCALCSKICYTSCSGENLSAEPKLLTTTQSAGAVSTASQSYDMQLVPWIPSTITSTGQVTQRSTGSQCTCTAPTCNCVPTIGSNYLSCSCQRSSPCSCTALEQMEQCHPVCQDVCQRSCTINCAVCSNACFVTCSAPSAQSSQVPQIQPSTVPTIPSSDVPVIPQIQSTAVQCTCPSPKCYCVPTVGSMYQTCDCTYSTPCNCSPEQQLQQCQPTCQDVCQRSCTVNCAICSYSCFTTCSALPSSNVRI